MRKLAEKIEYSPGSVYLYFKNKEELFECLVEESFARLLKTFTTLRNGQERRDPVEELKKGLRTYVEFGLRNPNRSEEHTSELQSHLNLVCPLLLEKKNITQ